MMILDFTQVRFEAAMNAKAANAAKPLLDDEAFMSVADLKTYVAKVESAKASQSYAAMEAAEKATRELIEKDDDADRDDAGKD
jgi:hypothetical protein